MRVHQAACFLLSLRVVVSGGGIDGVDPGQLGRGRLIIGVAPGQPGGQKRSLNGPDTLDPTLEVNLTFPLQAMLRRDAAPRGAELPPSHHYGIPAWFGDPDNPPALESQRAYLKHHGLLLPAEPPADSGASPTSAAY